MMLKVSVNTRKEWCVLFPGPGRQMGGGAIHRQSQQHRHDGEYRHGGEHRVGLHAGV